MLDYHGHWGQVLECFVYLYCLFCQFSPSYYLYIVCLFYLVGRTLKWLNTSILLWDPESKTHLCWLIEKGVTIEIECFAQFVSLKGLWGSFWWSYWTDRVIKVNNQWWGSGVDIDSQSARTGQIYNLFQGLTWFQHGTRFILEPAEKWKWTDRKIKRFSFRRIKSKDS